MKPHAPPRLPVDDVLEELLAALEANPNAVLVAEPGAGKTTRVPLALLEASWRDGGRVIMLEPRRLAARAAAAFMAASRGETVGQTIGYRVRMDTRVSAETQIEVVTEGVFTRMILDDPELSGVAAVIFDEFHERSLDGDLGLALALDVQGALREDLRILPMSATLDAARVAQLMNDAPIISSKGRAFPVETRYLGKGSPGRAEDHMARSIQHALREDDGSVLAFLPGQGEIHRTARLLKDKLPPNVDVAPLFGAMDPKEQDHAIRPASKGRRKVVLATSIAQTSLTIEDVRIVIDSGLARVPRYEPGIGLTRLATEKVSRASADQRRGRAGRTQPGVCYRLWDAPQTSALPPQDAPAIMETDLSRLALDLAAWGVSEPSDLSFLDTPPAGAWKEARESLRAFGVLDEQGRITSFGRRLSALPLPPRLGRMLLTAAREDLGGLASEIAVVLSDPLLFGRAHNLGERIQVLRTGAAPRIKEARRLAARWLQQTTGEKKPRPAVGLESCGRLLALAYPDRVAQRRDSSGGYRMANGRGALLDTDAPLTQEPFLVIADVQGTAARGRIALAAPIDRQTIEDLFADQIETKTIVSFSPSGEIRARRKRLYGQVVLADEIDPHPDEDAIVKALLALIAKQGVGRLPWTKTQLRLRGRVNFLRSSLGDEWPDLSDAALSNALENWLAPFLAGKVKLSQIDAEVLGAALSTLLPWDKMAELERLLPSHFDAPSGSRVAIDYARAEGPTLSIRVQELFGLDQHPSVAGGEVPLILELLSPAHRPIQITRDLPQFWRGSWSDVKADMKGRYPKHPWPDNPLDAAPTHRVKPRK